MLDREIFSETDDIRFMGMGLHFRPIMSWSIMPDGTNRFDAHGRIWELRWLTASEDPNLLDRPIEENPVKYIADQAAQGIPIFERAWLLFVRLELEGRVQVKHEVRRTILMMKSPMVQQIPRPKRKGQ